MIPAAFIVLTMLAGCAAPALYQANGPASLQIVHPDYYSKQSPPRPHAPLPVATGKKPRYLAAEPPRPDSASSASNDIVESLEAASRALTYARQRLQPE